MQASFMPPSNLTAFVDMGLPSTLTFGGASSTATTGKSSASHSITPSDGSAGWQLNLNSYTYNGSAVSMSVATTL